MIKSGTLATETENLATAKIMKRDVFTFTNTRLAEVSCTNMKCLGMLFTLTTVEDHITMLCLNLNKAEFLTDV